MEEIIIEEAKKREKQSEFSDLTKSIESRGVWSAFGVGFIDGAVFATETMIEKACEWLKDNINDYLDWYDWEECRVDKDELLHNFKKEMKGGEE